MEGRAAQKKVEAGDSTRPGPGITGTPLRGPTSTV